MDNIIGNKYNKLTVVAYAGKELRFRKGKPSGWKHYCECLCDCGNMVRVVQRSITSGNTKSCGCLKRVPKGTTPLSKQPEYKVWLGMKGRCHNPQHVDFKNYGARGIGVMWEWYSSYEQFLKDMGRRPEGDMTIERVDNNGNYCADNCIWLPRSEQHKNKRPYGTANPPKNRKKS